MMLIEHKKNISDTLTMATSNKIKGKQMYKEQQKKFEHHYFACDFECTTLEPYTVYMVTIECIETHEQWLFSTIDEFLAFCEDHPNSTMYFHNGHSYDFEFILNRCFIRPDWSVSTGRQLKIIKQLDEVMLTSRGQPMIRKDQFVIAEAKITLLDSLDVVQGSIESLGRSINMQKGYGNIKTPLVSKIYDDNTWQEQDDYTGTTFTEHSTDFAVDCIKRNWWQYAMQDTAILAEVLRQYLVIENASKGKYTSASIAYDSVLNANPAYIKELDNEKQLAKSKEYKNFQIRLNRMAKEAYKGGISWANSNYAKLDSVITTTHGYHLDYTSMYPSIYMHPELYPLPYKQPCNEKTNLFIVHFKNLRATCKEDCFPLLKARTDSLDASNARFYLNHFRGDISLTSPEYKYLQECYENITFDSVQTVYYKEHENLEIALSNHGHKWYKVKENAKGAERTIAKMMLNSAYGYLGFFEKIIKLYKYKLVDSKIIRELHDESVTGMWNAEVPAASFITAYGRVKLARDINAIGINNVICCDTDSLFVIDKTLDELKHLVDIDDNKLGALKIEHTFTKIKAIKAKTWCIANDWTDPDRYAKEGYNPNKPIAQATAGSNYQFKNINNFNTGAEFYSSVKVIGVGGVGIKQQKKILGQLEYDN